MEPLKAHISVLNAIFPLIPKLLQLGKGKNTEMSLNSSGVP